MRSMRVVGLSDVDQGQHHEDEGLQGNDQNVEDGPN
jgi:hypothetical protein